jgi:sugar phosphate isomerase/epimerase
MSYSFHGLLSAGVMDIFGYLETVRHRYALSTADIWNGFLKSYDDGYLKLVKQHVDERGLEVVNLCCDWCYIWDDDKEVREQNEKVAWDCLRAAEILGARTIRMDAGVRQDSFTDEQFDYVVKKYREYTKRAGEIGADLGTENHWGATRNPKELRRLLEAVDMKNHGILLHMGNWLNGNLDENDRDFIGDAFHIHINYEHCVDADETLPPLFGKYKGCWTVESHKGFNEYNNVAFQLAQVRRVIAPLVYNMQKPVTVPEYKD